MKRVQKSLSSKIKLKEYQTQQQLTKKQTKQKALSSLKFSIKQSFNTEQNNSKIFNTLNMSNKNLNINRKIGRIESQPQLKINSLEKKHYKIQNPKKNAFGWTQLDKILYELSVQKKLRQTLEQQNQTLKKQINFLNNFSVSSSLRTSFNNKSKKNNNEQILLSNKQKILNRLNRKREAVVVNGESDSESTGLFSAKTKRCEESIGELYEQYMKKQMLPQLENVYTIMKKYFQEFKQNYEKLFIVCTQIPKRYPAKNIKSELFSQIENMLFLYQIPILYKSKLFSFNQDNAIKKQKNANNSYKKGKQLQSCENQSSKQILQEFQKIINIIIKSKKLMGLVTKNQHYLKLIHKIKQKI